MVLADRFAAALVATYVLVAFGAAFLADHQVTHLVAGGIALIPAALLLIPRISAMAVVTFMSLPCCLTASWYADGMQVPTVTDKLLWDFCPFMLVIGGYALVRTAQLALLARKRKEVV
jgi:hypothetical protein